MAKAKDIDGLDCSNNAFDGIVKVLQTRFEEVADLREAALDISGIEGVHNMRVALRRLRSVLRDFTPPLNKRALKQIKKNLKQLADALGTVRDLDVFIAALEKLQAGTEAAPVKEGIEKLIRENRGFRELARLDLTEILEPDNFDELQKHFDSAIDKAVSGAKSKQGFSDVARDVLSDGLDEFVESGASIYEPFNQNSLHEFRIAAKRLRYAAKLFAVCLSDELKPIAKEISRMQSFLGTVHDCDVWIKILGKRLRENVALDETDYQATKWLLSELMNKRTKEYSSALNLSIEWKESVFVGRLHRILNNEN